MQILINIPEEEYELIIGDEACGLNTLTRAVARGVVFPKGHGRLIDADWLKNAIHNFFYGLNRAVEEEDIQRYIDVARTLIEADKEDKE